MTPTEIHQTINQLVRLLAKAEGNNSPREPSYKEKRKAYYHQFLDKFN